MQRYASLRLVTSDCVQHSPETVSVMRRLARFPAGVHAWYITTFVFCAATQGASVLKARAQAVIKPPASRRPLTSRYFACGAAISPSMSGTPSTRCRCGYTKPPW